MYVSFFVFFLISIRFSFRTCHAKIVLVKFMLTKPLAAPCALVAPDLASVDEGAVAITAIEWSQTSSHLPSSFLSAFR